MASKNSGDGNWVTIKGNPVFIENGVITKGPKNLVGKSQTKTGSSSKSNSKSSSSSKAKTTTKKSTTKATTTKTTTKKASALGDYKNRAEYKIMMHYAENGTHWDDAKSLLSNMKDKDLVKQIEKDYKKMADPNAVRLKDMPRENDRSFTYGRGGNRRSRSREIPTR